MPSNGFTDEAQEALRTAQEIVQLKRHGELDIEHILLALLKSRAGLVSKMVESLNGDAGLLALRLDEHLNHRQRHKDVVDRLASIRISMRAQRLVSAAAEEAALLNDEYIGTNHMLICIAREKDGLAGQLLAEQNITPERIIAVLEDMPEEQYSRSYGRLEIELLSDEWARLNDLAAQAGVSVSLWARAALLRALVAGEPGSTPAPDQE